MADIDNFVVDRLVRKFGQDMFEAGLEGKKMVRGLLYRDYTTEELDEMINRTVEFICNYYENKKSKAKPPHIRLAKEKK